MTKNEAYDKIKERLASEHNYALDMDFARYFAVLSGRPETSVLGMIRTLTKRREAELSGRDKYARAMRSACESIWVWFQTADRYREMSTAVALDMLESYESECIWAVMIGQACAADQATEVK